MKISAGSYPPYKTMMIELSSQFEEHNYLPQETLTESLFIEIPAVPEHVSRARRAVGEFIRRQAWEAEDTDALLLALGEACTNAVRHGRPVGALSTVFVSCRRLDASRLQVEVRSKGTQFQPDLSVLARLPEDMFAMHGRGFRLMLALVDTVQVLSAGDMTTVRLIKTKTV